MTLLSHPLLSVTDLAPEDRARLERAALRQVGEWPQVSAVSAMRSPQEHVASGGVGANAAASQADTRAAEARPAGGLLTFFRWVREWWEWVTAKDGGGR